MSDTVIKQLCCFSYIQNFLPITIIQELEEWLHTLRLHNGTSKNGSSINRKQLWFQEEEKYFCPVWKERYDRWCSEKYTSILYKIQCIIEKSLNIDTSDGELNSCLINLYENGNDFIPPHKDSPISFGTTPIIINLSIGTTRILRLQNQSEILDFPLEHNSLFIMHGDSQINYHHEILKDSDIKTSRWSLTFRKMII